MLNNSKKLWIARHSNVAKENKRLSEQLKKLEKTSEPKQYFCDFCGSINEIV